MANKNDNYLNENGVLYLWQKIKQLVSGKVDKETGKGLSTNDYTNTDKTKVDKLITNGDGEKYLADDGTYKPAGGTITDVKVNGTSVVTGKIANIDITGKADKTYVDQQDNKLDSRITALENMGSYVGSFDKYADIPNNISDFNDITINDYVNIRTDETHSNLTTRYIATAINTTTGVITWTYDIAYSTDVSGKMEKVTGVTDNIAIFDNTGQAVSSGKKIADIWLKDELVAITNAEIDAICDGDLTDITN